MNDKLISVIMPTYNDRINYFEKAIRSILQQTYTAWELLVIDSSTNNEIADCISNIKDERICYYHQEKSGIAVALNYGISKAKGDYVARMDADDISSSDRFRKQVDFLELNQDVYVLGSSYEIINELGDIIATENVIEEHSCIVAKMIFDNCICHPSVMMRKELFEQGYDYQNVIAEDYDLWTRAICKMKFANLNDVLVKYRVHVNNTSSLLKNSVVNSDSISTKRYIENLIGISLTQYEQIHFIKNYYALFLEEHIKENRDNYILSQIELLRKIYQSNLENNFCDMKSLKYEIKKRLKLVINLVSIVHPQLLKIVNQDIWELMNIELTDIGVFLCDNEHRINKEINNKKSFYLYGMGERAQETLNQILKKKAILRWDLIGVIDKLSKEYIFGEEKCRTISLSSIENVDYIVISVKRKYEEVWNLLIENGIPSEKIISDSLFYYL